MRTAHVIAARFTPAAESLDEGCAIPVESRVRVLVGHDYVVTGWHTVATVGEALRFAACRGGFVSWREGVAP
jgi:hypothetical protein